MNLRMHADTISLSRGGLVRDPKTLLPASVSLVKKTDNRLRINLVGELEDPAMASSSCLLEWNGVNTYRTRIARPLNCLPFFEF